MQELAMDVPLYEKDIGGQTFRGFGSFRQLSSRDTVTARDLGRLGNLQKAGADSENHVVIFYENGVVEHNHSQSGSGRDCAVYFYE
jgi:hypothetical protein